MYNLLRLMKSLSCLGIIEVFYKAGKLLHFYLTLMVLLSQGH